jgi:hypothetical protein
MKAGQSVSPESTSRDLAKDRPHQLRIALAQGLAVAPLQRIREVARIDPGRDSLVRWLLGFNKVRDAECLEPQIGN